MIQQLRLKQLWIGEYKMDIKRLERLIAKFLISTSYSISKIIPVKKQIAFATFRTTNLTGNFKFIHDEVVMRNLDYKFKFLFKRFKPSLIGKADYLLHMIYAGYQMAISEIFIIDDYYFPVYVIKPRKGTKIIQVWHACGAFKKFGYDVLGKGYGASEAYINDIKIHSNYDVVTVSSKEVAKHYATAFNMDESKIYNTGIPRTDVFFDEFEIKKAKERVYSEFPELKGKKIVLFAPTFRGKGQTDVGFEMTIDLNKISSDLDDNIIFALKMHPFVKTRFNNIGSNIKDLSDYEDINDLLMVCDVLVTDYSSVVFECSLMEKPMVFYAPDKEEYVAERDFYYGYDDFVPGPVVTTTEDVAMFVNQKDFDLKPVKDFKKRFFDYCDGGSTKRFVDSFIENK